MDFVGAGYYFGGKFFLFHFSWHGLRGLHCSCCCNKIQVPELLVHTTRQRRISPSWGNVRYSSTIYEILYCTLPFLNPRRNPFVQDKIVCTSPTQETLFNNHMNKSLCFVIIRRCAIMGINENIRIYSNQENFSSILSSKSTE